MIASSVTATSATVSFDQFINTLSVDIYTVTLTSTTCNGVPTRKESTTSNSVTVGSLEAGIQYSVVVTGRNNVTQSEGTGTTTLTTAVTGKHWHNCNKLYWVLDYFTAPTGSPGVPSASVIMSTNITLTWTEIDCLDRNGFSIHYVIQYGEGTNRNITINTQSNTTTHLITGLKPFTQYTFTVAGVNSINTGPFSESSEIKTAECGKNFVEH